MFDEDFLDDPDGAIVIEPEDHHINDVNNDIEDTEEQENAANPESTTVTPVIKKRIIRNPRVKLNIDRLCGERGIPSIMDHFKDFTFKGQGHEEEELDCLLSKLELWTHRLNPSMNMRDTLSHMEKLGKKRPVQVCLQKIRLDMPIISSDFVSAEADRDVAEGTDDPHLGSDPDLQSDMAFDQLFQGSNVSETPRSIPLTEENNYFSPPAHRDLPLVVNRRMELTDEQLQRIEQNRKLAAERRKARMSNATSTMSEALNVEQPYESANGDEIRPDSNSVGVSDGDEDDDFVQKSSNRQRIMDRDDDDDDSLDIDALVNYEDEVKMNDKTESEHKQNEESVTGVGIEPDSNNDNIVDSDGDDDYFVQKSSKRSRIKDSDDDSIDIDSLVNYEDVVKMNDKTESEHKQNEESVTGVGIETDSNNDNIDDSDGDEDDYFVQKSTKRSRIKDSDEDSIDIDAFVNYEDVVKMDDKTKSDCKFNKKSATGVEIVPNLTKNNLGVSDDDNFIQKPSKRPRIEDSDDGSTDSNYNSK